MIHQLNLVIFPQRCQLTRGYSDLVRWTDLTDCTARQTPVKVLSKRFIAYKGLKDKRLLCDSTLKNFQQCHLCNFACWEVHSRNSQSSEWRPDTVVCQGQETQRKSKPKIQKRTSNTTVYLSFRQRTSSFKPRRLPSTDRSVYSLSVFSKIKRKENRTVMVGWSGFRNWIIILATC